MELENTYVTLIKNIIEKFDYNYTTTTSLQNIIKSFDELSTNEKEKHGEYINLIKKVIFSYGDQTKRLSDHQVNGILELLRGSLVYLPRGKYTSEPPTQEVDAFTTLINNIIKGFFINYTTIHSLQDIIFMFRSFRSEQLLGHLHHLKLIEDTIKSFGNDGDKMLTEKQSRTMLKVLRNENNKHPCDHRKYIPYVYTSPTKVEKFDFDDVIHEVVFNLLSNLNRDISGSGLTLNIVDYFEVMEMLMQDDFNKYNNISTEIRECLQLHGWTPKSEKTLGGFRTEPKRAELVQGIQGIYDTYF
jgi:hypothetical protein